MADAYAYHFDEAVIEVPPGFVDESSQILRWGKGDQTIVLTVQRRTSPVPVSEVVASEIAALSSQLTALRMERDESEDVPIPTRRVAFRHVKNGRPLYHHHVYFELSGKLIALSAIGAASLRSEIDAIVDRAAASVRFRD